MHTFRFSRKTLLLGSLLLLGALLVLTTLQIKAHSADAYALLEDPLFENACFIGDSFTNGLKTYTKLEAYFIEEVGMTLAKGLQRLPELDAMEPSRFYILLGINDLGHGYTTEEFLELYGQMVHEIRDRFPKAPIYVQAIAPVTAVRSREDATHSNEKINEFNQALKEFARQERLKFLNPWSLFREDGALRASDSSDGLHLEYHGYFVWLDQIRRLAR